MSPAALLWLIVCLSSLATVAHASPAGLPLNMGSTSHSPSSSSSSTVQSVVQVVYVIDGSTLTTYDVDPQTLNATQVSTLALDESTYPLLVSSPNDRFVYYIAYDDPSELSEHLWVYTTDASGAPHSPAVQEIDVNGLFGIPQVDPSQNFFYAVYESPSGAFYNSFTIQRFALDPKTGFISELEIEAKYRLPNISGEVCTLSILGFNPAGNKLYDEVYCGTHGGPIATYNERSVNLQTGTLGPDLQVYSWSCNTGGGFESVQFFNDIMFDFVIPNDYQSGVDSVNIYPLKPDTSTPLLQCAATMLEACGNATGVMHPSGKYVFMAISQDSTQIDKVETNEKKIVDTSNYIPYTLQYGGQFSPDGTIVYALSNNVSSYDIEIYGFDEATSAVTLGGVIGVPSLFDPFFVAERY
jgi:hypothetical protein